MTLLQRGMSSCKALIFSFILSRRLCTSMQYFTSLKADNHKKRKQNLSKLYSKKRHTLSERLWTSAARDLFVDVDPRTCFFASTDSNSTSFKNMKNKTIEIKSTNMNREFKKMIQHKA